MSSDANKIWSGKVWPGNLTGAQLLLPHAAPAYKVWLGNLTLARGARSGAQMLLPQAAPACTAHSWSFEGLLVTRKVQRR